MDEIQLKICDIQGRLFELSADNLFESSGFIKVFMNSELPERYFVLDRISIPILALLHKREQYGNL